MSKKKSIVTNAVRIVKSENVPFKTLEYHADEVGENFGVKIAELTGILPEKCFKTLVVRGKEIVVVCIPVNREADLKKIASVSGDKKVEMLPTKELLEVTGYIRGGVSPIGMKKHYKTYIDKSCLDFDEITVSGGVCGLSVLLSPQNLIKITGATAEDIVKEI
ncbi:MAG: Cys-tRNA(Pro) deacylase [Clostridia bacterium]|nr:Cys-tRNA(Pro) deacylase [Clostridia bacterium]